MRIAGVGPVSVAAVRRMLSDAFLSVVFRKGTDVVNVVHLGRQVTAAQRTAMEARGCRCERCGSKYLLDIDHNEGWALTHDTRLEDLSWLCWHCHDLKTRRPTRVRPGARHRPADRLRRRGPPSRATCSPWLTEQGSGAGPAN